MLLFNFVQKVLRDVFWLFFSPLTLMHFTHHSLDKDGELGFQKGSSQGSVLHRCAIKEVVKKYIFFGGGQKT